MTGISLHTIGFRLGQLVRTVLRVDQWPERFGPWIETARDVFSFAARRARDVRLAQVASSLTFTTVLSLVPLLAVALSVFTAFPLFGEYRESLERNLLQGLFPGEYAGLILRYLNEFTAQAARLTAFGVAFLVVTALLMIYTVDHALNDIWRVRRARPVMQRVLVYWALLTLAPLAIGASVALTSQLVRDEAGIARVVGPTVLWLLEYGPFLIGVAGFAVLYVVVPNRRVLWRDAVVGALVASVLGEVLTAGFALYIRTGTVANIYGAFAVVPLFLLWVYLSWLALLFGAAIAATLPILRSTRFADELRAGDRFVTAVALLGILLRARLSGRSDGRVALESLARDVRAAPDRVEGLLDELEALGYVSRLDGVHAGSWLLTCDPQRANLVSVFRRFAVDPANTLISREPAGRAAVRDGLELAGWIERGLAADWIAQPLQSTLTATPARAPDRA
jgi:membrane protein